MKRIISIIASAALMMTTLCSCSNGADNGKKKIVTTIFPEYDWVMNILGDKADDFEVTLLLDNGTDLHSYQPSVEDLAKIHECDMFIYVGGESDAWVSDALSQSVNKDMIVIDLLDELGNRVVEEEVIEGMQAEDEEEEEEEEEGPEYDEHVWLSLRNAYELCEDITDGIIRIDPDNAEIYADNMKEYQAKLLSLDQQYVETVDNAAFDTLVFGDRFPFRYLVDDYGLDYYAAFVGCSAESEASFETVIFLAEKVDALGVGHIMTIEGNNTGIAESVRDNTLNKDQEILELDSMQSVTSADIENGADYLSIMSDNLNVLQSALN